MRRDDEGVRPSPRRRSGVGRSRAASVSARVRDVSELLAAAGPRAGAPLPLRVTYDAPCHLLHAQRVVAPPLAVLRAIPGPRRSSRSPTPSSAAAPPGSTTSSSRRRPTRCSRPSCATSRRRAPTGSRRGIRAASCRSAPGFAVRTPARVRSTRSTCWTPRTRQFEQQKGSRADHPLPSTFASTP